MQGILTKLGWLDGLTLRYLLALTLIAGMIVSSYAVLRDRIEKNLDDAYIINTAGIQRMLSQRIALMAREIVSADTDAGAQMFAAKLAEALARIKANHAELTDNIHHASMTPAVAALYDNERGVNARMNQFTTHADQFLDFFRRHGRHDARTEAQMLEIVQIARNGFLDELDAVVKQYESDFDREFADFMRLESLFAGMALALLVLEAFLIFRPMVRTIDRQMHSLHEANAELREFTFRISHDLRAPIASSLGMVKIAQDARLDDDRETIDFTIDRVEESMVRMDVLIEDIINVSRQRNEVMEAEPLILADMVDGVLTKLSGMPGFSSMDVTTDIQVAETISTQRLRLQQILENLVSNAVKYADPAKPHCALAIAARRSDSGQCEIIVSDNGVGLPADCQDNLFQMFKRFHPKLSYGSGLGLYLVQQNAGAIGGNVSYEPLPDGSQFTLRFAA